MNKKFLIIFFLVFFLGCGKKQVLKPANVDIKTETPKLIIYSKTNEPAKNDVFYTVSKWGKSKDCLWNISKRLYSCPYLWTDIYQQNKDTIKNPDVLYEKQLIKLDINKIRLKHKNLNCQKCNEPYTITFNFEYYIYHCEKCGFFFYER